MVKIKNAVNNDLKGVFFDYGGVLEDLEYNEKSFHRGVSVLRDILKMHEIEINFDVLVVMLKAGQEEYSSWYKSNDFRELPNEKLWSLFFLKDLCREKSVKDRVYALSDELSSIYEYYLYRRRPVQDVKMVIKTLFHAGYVLALISNTISKTLIPERMKKYCIDMYFSATVLSVNFGFRKPRREIFFAALKKTGLEADNCIYIGDTHSRDIEGSRNAGFRKSVLFKSGLTAEKDRDYNSRFKPDLTLQKLSDLYQILR